MKINSIQLRGFLNKGEIFGIKIGDNIKELDENNLLQLSAENHPCYDYKHNNIVTRIGTMANNEIEYIILRTEFINEEIDLFYNNINVREINLLQLLSLLDKDGLEWQFKSCSLKVLVVKIINTNVEIIYDCNIYEGSSRKNIQDPSNYFLYSFQVFSDN